MKNTGRRQRIVICVSALLIAATPAFAQSDTNRIAQLEEKLAALAGQLAELRTELDQAKESKVAEGAGIAEEIQTLRDNVSVVNQMANSANEWKTTTSVMHIAGYGSAGFINRRNGANSFIANFNPIFHFQYNDTVLWESELETEIGEDGATDMGLEYSSIDFFLNDNLIFVAGKFISPLGNFRQNMHPSWINKLGTAPPGFGHDGAAPLTETGLQLRGGMNFGQRSKVTYAGYVGVGPKLEGAGGEIHGIDTGGFTEGPDGQGVAGGRLSILPFPKFEIGVSGAFGDAAVAENDGIAIEGDPLRDYEVVGFDAAYQRNNFDFRSEYISQKIANSSQSIAPDGGTWKTWYTQGAYKFGKEKWEGVMRYTDYSTPDADSSQEQWAFGLNYLVTPNAIVKLGYEINDGLDGEITNDDILLFQIAYGY